MKEGEGPAETLNTTPRAKDFFERVLSDVKSDGGFTTSAASDLYLVGLLTEAAHSPAAIAKSEQPFTLRLVRAMGSTGGERFERLRRLGDDVLFVSGFFADHLRNKGLALDYVASVGQQAYDGAARMLRRHAAGPQVFDELAGSFEMFVALLRQVADSLFAASARDELGVLELYERWQRSQSEVLARALLDLGLLPTRGSPETN